MMEGEVRRARAWAQAADGDRAGARALLESAVADALDRGADALAGIAGWELARLGDRGAAAAALTPLLGREGPLGLRAAHAVAADRRDAGELDRISAELEAFGFELEAAEAAAEAARSWARVGDVRRATARDRRVEALRAACEGAFTPLLAVGAGGDRLTDRQREVALLAARGLTSKAVAEQLGLSRRTVDNNLQQVFVKLGIRRRTELADALGLEP